MTALTRDAARAMTDEVKADALHLWDKLLGLYEGGAHAALGYGSWGEYYEREFGESAGRGYQLLRSAEVRHLLAECTTVHSLPANEAVARELAPLLDEPEALREAWSTAVEQHGPTPTAAQTREIVRPPEPPGDDTRFSAVENAYALIRLLPPAARIRWPVEPGDVDAMDEAMNGIKDWLGTPKRPGAFAAWKRHKRELREASGVRG